MSNCVPLKINSRSWQGGDEIWAADSPENH